MMYPLLGLLVVCGTCIFQVTGQCTNATFPLELTATSTPQYLSFSAYPGNSSCGWLISASSSAYIILNVETITLSASTNLADPCTNKDTLTIYDGANATFSQLVQSCHDSSNSINALFPTSTSVYLVFTSESSPYAGSFNILYFANDTTAQPDCNGTVTLYASSILNTFMSPWAGDSTVACNITFLAHLDNTFTFQLYYMNYPVGSVCSTTNGLTLYDGSSDASTQLLQSCSEATTYTFTNVTTTGSTAYMKLTVPQGDYGVLLTYFTQPYTITTCGQDVNITAVYQTENYIDSENFPNSDYSNYLRCKWLLTPQNDSMAVEVYFANSTFDVEYNYYCGYDFVVLYDGVTTDRNIQINRFCGDSVPGGTYRTTGNQMLVYFYTDYAIRGAGFRLVYKAVDLACDSSYPEYDATYNVNLNTTVYRNISSPNFDGVTYYPKNADVFWVFTNNNFTYYRIVLEIVDIKLEWSVNCLYDKVVAYNGTCITDTILGSACGRRKMRFDMFNEKHLVRFISDGITEYKGFWAEYYIIPLPTPIPPTTTTVQNGPPVEVVIEAMDVALTNYSTGNLPTRALNDPINATIDFYLVGVNGLDEADQIMTTTGQFIVTWLDGNIAWEPTKRSGMTRMLVPQNDVWKPDIVLLNGVTKITAMGATFMYIDIDYNGTSVWRPYQILESNCKVDMKNYPYDKQTCYIQFGSFSSSDSDILINFAGDGMKIHERFTENSVWKLMNYESNEETLNSQKVIRFTLKLERSPAYVTFYITIPLVMLAYINVFTFTIPTGSGEKSGFAITVFLSFVVVLIVVSESMPDTSETISLFAAYILGMTMMSGLTTCITVVQIRLMSLQIFQYEVPVSIKRAVSFTQKKVRLVFCFKRKERNSVESIGRSEADTKRIVNTNTVTGATSANGPKSVDSLDGMSRYGNRRFSWLEDDHLYSAQSSSSGASTSMSNTTDDMGDNKIKRELTATSITLFKQKSELDERSNNDSVSDNGSAMFSDDEEIEELIQDITNLDNEAEQCDDVDGVFEDSTVTNSQQEDATNGQSKSDKIVENPSVQKDATSRESCDNENSLDTSENENSCKKSRNSSVSGIDNHAYDSSDLSITNKSDKIVKRVTFKDDHDILFDQTDVIETANTENLDEERSKSTELIKSNTHNDIPLTHEPLVQTQPISRANTIAEISLERIDEQNKEPMINEKKDNIKVDRPSTSIMHTKPTLSGNRPSSRQQERPSQDRPFSRQDRPNSRLVRTESRLSNVDNSEQNTNKTNNPFAAPSMAFPDEENQPFPLGGRESRLSLFYPETNAELDVYEWEKGNKQLLDDDRQTEVDKQEDIVDEPEDEEDEITWENVVDCSDVYLFIVYLIVTTILTLAFFLPMILS